MNKELKFLCKLKKYIFFGVGGGAKVGGEGGAGAGPGRSVWGVRVVVNEQLKFLGKFTKKNRGGGGGRVGGRRVRVDVNAMLGVGDDVGYGGC